MSDQIDILHPLTTLEWKWCGCSPSHTYMNYDSTKCVALGDKVYLYDYKRMWASSDLASKEPGHEVTFDPESWTALQEFPVFHGTLTTYRSQLVLVGGQEFAETTNKLWTLSEGVWHEPLPPMPTTRYQAVVISATDPECLIVMGGYHEVWTDILQRRASMIALTGDESEDEPMEVLIGDEWFSAEHPPSDSLKGGVVHNGVVYVHDSRGHIFYCDYQSLIASCRHPDADKPLKWSEMNVITYPIVNLLSFGQQLVMIRGRTMYAYHPLTDEWPYLGHIPVGQQDNNRDAYGLVLSSAVRPIGGLVAIQQESWLSGPPPKVMRLSLMASPYDPDHLFYMSSLTRLEAGGIKIVTALHHNIDYLKTELDLHGRLSVQDVIEKWEYRGRQAVKNCPPRTWRSLLRIISQGMNLTGLSQQIEDYLQHGDANKQYLDAYRQILAKQETLEMWFIKVILLGAPRLGKTTMRRRLTGEIDDISSSGEGEQPSTGTVESGPSIVIRNLSSTTALITESEWLATKDLTEETCAILQYFYSHISKKKVEANSSSLEISDASQSDNLEVFADSDSSTSDSISDFDSSIFDSVVLSEPASSFLSTPLPVSSHHKSYSPPPQYRFSIPEMIRNAVSPACWREITQVCRDTAFLNMGDTGGQPEFMDMQPALTVGPALYLFFCKLTDDLDSLYKVSYLSPSTKESTVPRKSAYTAKEVLFTSLASIACFRSSSSTSLETTSSTDDQLLASCKSIAYIIGTHKDLVSEEQIDEFDEKLQQIVRPTSFFNEDIVQFSSEERMVLPVDNMHGGSSEVDWVRKVLEENIKKHFQKVSIPASWLVLSLCLRKREERMASLESVQQLASELGIPDNEVKVALWFLHHHAGVLMYFPNLPELKDTVICDNQIIYDSASNLITNTFKFQSVGKAASERFRKTGQFSLEDIRRATAGVSGDYIPLKKLVKLLAYCNILVSFVKSTLTSLSSRTPSSEEMYFMPSVLLNATHEEMASWWGDTRKQVSPAPLFITYQCGFVPIGVFPAMIANLTTNAALQLRVGGIRKNRVQFNIGSDFDTITLISQPTYYAVHISRRESTKTPTHEVCATVRGLVESTLKTVTSRMNYTFSAEYQLGFECPSHPGREHLCVVNSDDPSPHVMCCQGDMDNLEAVDMQSQHLVWFRECSSCDHADHESGDSPRLLVEKSTLSLPPSIALSLTSLNNLLKWTDDQGQECEIRLVDNVSAKWYEFGMTLGVKLNQLDAWEAQHRGDAKKCWNKVMDDWLTRGGSRDYPATWEGLYSLLNDLGYGNVAVKLKNAVVGQVSHSNAN